MEQVQMWWEMWAREVLNDSEDFRWESQEDDVLDLLREGAVLLVEQALDGETMVAKAAYKAVGGKVSQLRDLINLIDDEDTDDILWAVLAQVKEGETVGFQEQVQKQYQQWIENCNRYSCGLSDERKSELLEEEYDNIPF